MKQADSERPDGREDEPDALDEAGQRGGARRVSVCRASIAIVQAKLPAPKPMRADHNHVTVVGDQSRPSHPAPVAAANKAMAPGSPSSRVSAARQSMVGMPTPVRTANAPAASVELRPASRRMAGYQPSWAYACADTSPKHTTSGHTAPTRGDLAQREVAARRYGLSVVDQEREPDQDHRAEQDGDAGKCGRQPHADSVDPPWRAPRVEPPMMAAPKMELTSAIRWGK